jgi:hypothetical protein
MPLAWNELNLEQPPRFHVSDFSQWSKRLSRNPWKNLPSLQQHLHL